MIDISNIQTYGWEAAIRGMRNSRQSWEKSDSDWEDVSVITPDGTGTMKTGEKIFRIGSKDLELSSQLAANGGSHAKFRRMIGVSMDICAPLYWWKEFDTYKIGTVANSTSTMYSITNKEFTPDDFSTEHLLELRDFDSPVAIDIHGEECYYSTKYFVTDMLCQMLNFYRDLYLQCENNSELRKQYWWQIIQLLPSSYNQLRTVSMNYEVLSHIVHERWHHKLDEWRRFCKVALDELPYAKELIFCENLLLTMFTEFG